MIAKNIIFRTTVVLLSLFVLTGCSKAPLSEKSNEAMYDGLNTRSESNVVNIIRSIMELDYASMTVADFNDSIQMTCKNAGTNIFEVISDVYEHFSVYNEAGEFMYIMFNDKQLETFMNTTLEYSAQEIFGEPFHLYSVPYMTMTGMTAMETYQKAEDMSPDEWENYFKTNIVDISIFPILSYEIETDIQNPKALLVADRDNRINDVNSSIKAFFLGLDAEAVKADSLEADILAEFKRLSAMYSDGRLVIKCRIQAIERDMR